MITEYKSALYRISYQGVSMIENALGNPNLIQISVVLGCSIIVSPQQGGGIQYLPNGESRKWFLYGVNTKLNKTGRHFIYARLNRDGDQAYLIFSVNDYAIDGTINGENPSPAYCYVKVGEITETDALEGATTQRKITFDFGKYQTDETREENYWQLRSDSQGNEYIITKYPVLTQGSLTQYATLDPVVPSIFEGIPYDNQTIWFNPATQRVEVIGGTGGGEAGSVKWVNITGKPTWIGDAKPTYNWSEIQGEKPFYTKEEIASKYVTIDTEQEITALKHFTAGLSVGESKKKIYEENGVVYIDADVAVTGAMTFYASAGRSVSTIMDGVTVDEETITKGSDNVLRIKNAGAGSSFDENAMWSALSGSSDNQINKSHLTDALAGYATESWVTGKGYATESWVASKNYATTEALNAVSNKLNDFLEGSDTDTIINKWKELEAFLSGMAETDNLAEILETKADKKYVDSTFVTLATKQTITGEKTFSSVLNTAAIKASGAITTPSLAASDYVTIAGIKLRKLEDGALMLEGNLALTGALTMYASNGQSFDTIYDGLPIDNDTIYWQEVDGSRVLKAKEGSGSSFDKSAMWTALAGSTTEQINKSHLTTALTGYATEAWVTGKNYAVKATTLAGYGITDGINAVSVTGTGNAITAASISGHTLTLTKGSTFSLSGHKHAWSDITSGKPTTLSGYGITDAYTKTESDNKYLLKTSYTAADVLAKLKTVDGSGSGLDADLFRGRSDTDFTHTYCDGKVGLNTSGIWVKFMTFKDYVSYDCLLVVDLFNLEGGSRRAFGRLVISTRNDSVRYINIANFGSQLIQDIKLVENSSYNKELWIRCTNTGYEPYYAIQIIQKRNVGSINIGNLTTQSTEPSGSILNIYAQKTGYAAQLINSQTIWGQPFDGTKPVTGALTSVTDITGTGTFSAANLKATDSVYVNGIRLHKTADGVITLEGNLAVTGGITTYAIDPVSASTVMDGVVVDGTTIKKENGKLVAVGGGEAGSVAWGNISGKPSVFATNIANITDLHSSWDSVLAAQKPAWLTAVSIATISDLNSGWDALLKAAPSTFVTRWPTISEVTNKQSLIVKLNGGTTEGTNQFTYNATAAKTINITASSIGAASSSHNHSWSNITSGKPTTLAGYGITDAPTKTGSGASGTWGININGSADRIINKGNVTAIGGTTTFGEGLYLYKVYNNGYPCSYGNLLRIGGSGLGELVAEWTGDSSTGHLFYRSKRDVSTQAWSGWKKVAFIDDTVSNADKVDNVHNGDLTARYLNPTSSVDYLNNYRYNGFAAWSTVSANRPVDYGVLFQFSSVGNPSPGTNDHWVNQIAYGTNARLYTRQRINTAGWTTWKTIAFLDDNVYSASKLANTRYIWGRPFNGEGNVSGELLGAGGAINLENTNEINSYSGNLYLNHKGNGAGGRGTTQNVIVCANGGNVGIGIDNPDYKLKVQGNLGVSDFIFVDRAASAPNKASVVINKPGTYYFGIGDNGVDDTAIFGYCDITGKWANDYSMLFTFRGNILATGGATFYSSDIRYKSIMQQVNLSLLDIAKAPSFVYRWNRPNMNQNRLNLGGSAQYTQSVLPWAVNDNDNFLSMDYATVAYTFAVHTARHLMNYETRTDKKIKKLENRVKYLEKQLKKLGYEEAGIVDDQSV